MIHSRLISRKNENFGLTPFEFTRISTAGIRSWNSAKPNRGKSIQTSRQPLVAQLLTLLTFQRNCKKFIQRVAG